ncbi:MAG: c-type cytochrome [Dechloromonas sp.]|nr:MAG: c-type cytochrome [Dechloromonas sp.]
MRSATRKLFRMVGFLAAASCAVSAHAQPSQVQRGEYLARAGDCISCHTANGGIPYAGGYRLDTPFGYLLAPNITPDNETGIGRWSSADFYRAMHDGVNKRGQDMYPAMPYDFYTKLTRADSDAIFAYLRTLKPVRNAVDINQLRFPFNQRWSMAVWRELYFDEGTFTPDPAQTASWNRGAYLVEGLGHCSSCHSPRNALGGIEQSKAFTGASIDDWFAPNLTSNLHTGLGEWTAAEIATYLKTGAVAGRTTAFGPMAEVVTNSLSHLSDADLAAMAEYLKAIPPNSSLRTGKPAPDASRVRGATLYMDHCGGCHQAKGRGIPGVFPPLAGNGAVIAPDPANVIKVVLKGLPQRGAYIPMPALGGQLDDQQIADIANYVRTSWGNTASPNSTAAMVARLRKDNR